MEGDNGGSFDAVKQANEEVRHVGESRPSDDAVRFRRRSGSTVGEEVRDVQGPDQSAAASCPDGVGAEERSVTESGRVEPASRGVHKEVQRRDEAAEARVAESVP